MTDYLKWGLLGAIILGIVGWIYVLLGRMGPEFVRPYEPRDFVLLVFLITVGFFVGWALKWIHGKLRRSK